MLKVYLSISLLLCLAVQESIAIWCYRCTSATPGCGEDFNWRGIGYLGDACPEDNDICVKIVERKGAKVTYTRDCLSVFNFRTDIPADHYEGCRSAVKDYRLANYVNHTTKEHDVGRDNYPDVTFCFCFLDHRCNSASSFHIAITTLVLACIASIWSKLI